MAPVITEIKEDAVKSYKQFILTGLLQDEHFFRISPQDDLNSPFPTKGSADSFTLGAYINGALAGVASFMRDGADREKLRHKGILFRMYVSPSFRGYGIAQKLIEQVIAQAKKLDNMEQINLTVIETNTAAKSLYAKFGFITFSKEHNAIKWKGSYYTEEQMVLFLK